MAKQRFRETVNIQPVDVRTGAAQGMHSVANIFRDFKSLGTQAMGAGFQMRREIETEKGFKEGLAATIERTPEGRPIMPGREDERPLLTGTYAKAYNRGLMTAYMATMDNDSREALAGMYNESGDNIIAFNEKSQQYFNEVIQGVDPAVRSEVAQSLNKSLSIYRTKVQTNQFAKQRKRSQDETVDNIRSATGAALRNTRNGDNALAADDLQKTFKFIDAGVQADYWTAKDAAIQKKAISRDIEEQSYLGKVDNLASTDIKKAREKIITDSKKIPKEFTPDEWRSTITEAFQNVNRMQLEKGKVSRKALKQLKINESIDRGYLFLKDGVYADPAKSSQDRKDVNAAYDDWYEKKRPNMTPEEGSSYFMNFVTKTGILPDKAISRINANMRVGDDAYAISTARIVETLQKNESWRPIIKDLPPEARNIALAINENLEVGMDEALAVATARAEQLPLSDIEKADINTKIQDEAYYLEDDLLKLYDRDPQFEPGLFSFQPEIPSQMYADHEVAFRKFMVISKGNVERAKKLSYDAIKNSWALSRVGGELKIMKYGPESMYARSDIPNTWQVTQFQEDMKSAGLDPDELTIEVDMSEPYTSQPKYFIRNIDTNELVYNKGGKTKVLWQPQWNETIQYQMTTGRGETARTKAIEKRKEMENFDKVLSEMDTDEVLKSEEESIKEEEAFKRE